MYYTCNMNKSKLIQIRVDPDLKDAVDELAEMNGYNSSELLRRFIEQRVTSIGNIGTVNDKQYLKVPDSVVQYAEKIKQLYGMEE